MKLLSTTNTKTMRGEKFGYLTFVLHLAPSRLSGYQTCPMASAGCAAACLNTAGMGKFKNVQAARIRKTRWFFEDRESFMTQLVKDIQSAIRKAERLNLKPAFRLNCLSDIRWENIPVAGHRNVMELFPDVKFYDYTKLPNRRNLPANYHLTFSRSEENEALALEVAQTGINVAVVFTELPPMWNGYHVIDGTETDLRFLDSKGVVVGLLAKGRAKNDQSGFVVAA